MKLARRGAALVVVAFCLVACAGTSPTSQVTLGKKIAFLVPDSRTDRFETKDRPFFEAKLQTLCSTCELIYRNADLSASTQQKQAEAVLAGGVSAIVLDPVDNEAASAIVAKAAKRFVPVIAYDRMIQNTENLNYFVGFDNEAVGALQASSLLSRLSTSAKPTIVMINGEAGDSEASLLKKGAHSVLDGKVTIANEYDAAWWTPDDAKADMGLALTALSNKVDGVYAANDNLATGAIAAMKQAKINPLPLVTGGDAQLQAIQRIVAGDQYMTVYKAIKREAEAAAQLAYELAYGVVVPASVTNGKTVSNGAKDVPAVVVKPLEVTKKTLVSTVLADGFWTRSDICTPQYLTACHSAGIG
jgi:D-xylose transport system substrate-binding protein